MQYRFYITISSVRTEVFPLGFIQTTLLDEVVKDQIFYRRRFVGTLSFQKDDFDLFHMVETVNNCEDLLFEIEQKDSGADTYHDYWNGHFSTTDGRFDLDNCTFSITPLPYDDYVPFDLLGDELYNILDATPAVTTRTFDYTYTRNRFLIDVIEYIVNEIIPGATVTSNFLTAATNPIINNANQYRYLTIAQKSDIKRPSSSNPATVARLSFNELMSMLKMMNLWWAYDGTTVRIEHFDYWTSAEGMDLRTQSVSKKANKYSYLKDEMPYYENFNFMEAENANFTKHWFSYLAPCVDKNITWEYSARVTTDLTYIEKCMEDIEGLGLASNISDDGFVILSNYLSGGNYYVYYGTSYADTIGVYNFPMSWSYLLRAFHLHGRVMMSGFINSIPIDFISERKKKSQQITAIVCYEDGYEPSQYITTELGETWFGGEKGFVKTASIKPTGQVDFNLLYGADKDTSVVMPPRPKTLHSQVDTAGGDVTTTLSEPSDTDTTYYIWWNNSTCQEITIPAGTIHQVDAIEEIGEITDIEFNVNQILIDEWNFVYNDNEEWDLCTDEDCGPDEPPAVPDAPVAIAATQSGFCEDIHVTWNASDGATSYEVWRLPDATMDPVFFGLIDTVAGLSYDDVDAGDIDGEEFQYKIKACNVNGCSGFSNVVSKLSQC